MQLPRLQPIRKELESAFYHNAPAWVDIPYYFAKAVNYTIHRYMPGQYLHLPPGDNYHLPHRIKQYLDGEHYHVYTDVPLVVLLVTKDDVEQGWMLAEPLRARPFCISEYVLKQQEHYLCYRRRNNETMTYDNWGYFPYLRKYQKYDINLLNYIDRTSYYYTVVTKDDPERGWARAAVPMNKKEV